MLKIKVLRFLVKVERGDVNLFSGEFVSAVVFCFGGAFFWAGCTSEAHPVAVGFYLIVGLVMMLPSLGWIAWKYLLPEIFPNGRSRV